MIREQYRWDEYLRRGILIQWFNDGSYTASLDAERPNLHRGVWVIGRSA